MKDYYKKWHSLLLIFFFKSLPIFGPSCVRQNRISKGTSSIFWQPSLKTLTDNRLEGTSVDKPTLWKSLKRQYLRTGSDIIGEVQICSYHIWKFHKNLPVVWDIACTKFVREKWLCKHVSKKYQKSHPLVNGIP